MITTSIIFLLVIIVSFCVFLASIAYENSKKNSKDIQAILRHLNLEIVDKPAETVCKSTEAETRGIDTSYYDPIIWPKVESCNGSGCITSIDIEYAKNGTQYNKPKRKRKTK